MTGKRGGLRKNETVERKKPAQYKAAVSDPMMITISMYEINSFLVQENTAKIILIIGSILFGGVCSAFLSNIAVSFSIQAISILMFVAGLVSDVYIVHSKFKELKHKGATQWQ